MRRTGRTRELTVGITLTLALVLFAALIMLLSRENRLFRPTRTYTTSIADSLGLKTGSPVVMGGVQIGAVTSIALPKEIQISGIEIGLSVDRGYSERIREGSTARTGFITLLSQEMYVNISPGDPSKPVLPDGAYIPLDMSQTLLETGQNAAENLTKVMGELGEVLVGINKGEGLIGQIVKSQNPYFGQDVVEKLESTIEKTNILLERMERGQGTFGKLVSDREYAEQTLGSVRSAASRLDRVLELVETKKGAAGELIQEGGEGKQMLEDLRAASASIRTVSARLESEAGLLGRLLNDRDYSEGLARDLKSISTSLASILHKIDSGEGSLGALINDPAVYEGLEDIVSGIRKSKTATMLLRHYEKKGAKSASPPTPSPPAPSPEEPHTPPQPEAPGRP